MEDSTLKTIDTGLLKCGGFAYVLNIVSSVILIFSLLGFGYYFFTKKPKYTQITTGTVLEANCVPYTTSSGRGYSRRTTTNYNCILKIKYNINNIEYISTLTTNDVFYVVGGTINIGYNDNQPNIIYYIDEYKKEHNRGIQLISCSSCIILLLILHIILYKKSDWYKRFLCFNLFFGNNISNSF
jgi:hypothetical protein